MSILQHDLRDGVLVLTFDTPDASVNTLSNAALTELEAALDALPSQPDLQGVVIASAKKSFLAGADLREVQLMKTPQDAARTIGWVGRIQGKIENAPVPVVAALNGVAMGGGFEIALAAHGRVGTPDLRLGLPEVELGLMPGAGGTQRLPRLIGLATSLEIVLNGKTLSAPEALDLGILSQIAPAEQLVDVAVDLARRLTNRQPWQATGWQANPPAGSAEATALIADARSRAAKRQGDADLAASKIIEVMEAGYALPLPEALALEAEGFASLATSIPAKNRIRTGFLGPQKLKAMSMRPATIPPTVFTHIAVAGGGLMGGGIAFTAAQNGLRVTVLEADTQGVGRCRAALRRSADRLVKRGKLTPEAAEALQARITIVTDWPDLSGVEAAIEAVPEVDAIKAVVLGRLASALPASALIASNTSTMAITGLARHVTHPERFIGMHFFSPVEVMPLLEIISGAQTSETALAQALDLAKIMRKTAITVKDGPGFFTSRIVGTYTGEALTLLAEGYDPALVDRAAIEFGMPVGPLAMADVVGLPLLKDIYAALANGGSSVVERGCRAREVLASLVDLGRKGRQGGGIYEYPEDGKPQAWAGLAKAFPLSDKVIAEEALALAEIKRRLFYVQTLEAIRAVEEGIITDLTQADVASTLGWAFPKSWGGVISLADSIGLERFVEDSEALAALYGDRFAPPALLRQKAADKSAFHPL